MTRVAMICFLLGTPGLAIPGLAQDLLAYGAECARRIASVPAFDCGNGTEAVVTVNGTIPAAYKPNMVCDRPALLPYGPSSDGQCVPGSRALVLRDDAKVQISAFCRQKKIRPPGSYLYDEVDVILHSVATGSTCWFQATPPDPNSPLDGRRVPPPNETKPPAGQPAARDFWNPPTATAAQKCAHCHDSDPFMYSPYVAQTGQLPKDPFGKYMNDIGAAFQAWPQPMALATPGNTCTGCHRIGNQQTCQSFIQQATGGLSSPDEDTWAKQYPNSHWMPSGNPQTELAWNMIYRDSVKQLAACCANPKEPGCSLRKIGKQAAAK